MDEGSIVKASAILRLGQPSISMQIKKLEDQLQKKLLYRKNKRLVPTEAGEIVYKYATSIFNLGSELLNTMNDRAINHTKIQIGIQGSVPKNLISKLTSFIYSNFDSEISFYDGPQEEIITKILNHKIDVALLNQRPVTTSKNLLYSKRILQSQVVFAGAKKYAPYRNKPIQSFESLPLILPIPNSPLRQSIEYYFNQHDLSINIIAEAEDTIIQKNMAISGNGIIPIMKDAIDTYVKEKQLYILHELEGIKDEVWLVSVKRDVNNPIANYLIKQFTF